MQKIGQKLKGLKIFCETSTDCALSQYIQNCNTLFLTDIHYDLENSITYDLSLEQRTCTDEGSFCDTALWNSLPPRLKQCHSLGLFKRKIKAHISFSSQLIILFSNYVNQLIPVA